MIRLFLLAALTGCGAATAASAPSPANTTGLEGRELATVDVRGTVLSAELLAARTSAVPDAVKRAARRITATCPYRRASFQLAIALQLEVSRVDAATLDPFLQLDWYHLDKGLRTHVGVLDALGVELDDLTETDHLHRLPAAAKTTRGALAASSDPVRDTLPLLEAIEPVVRGYDTATSDQISADYEVLRDALASDGLLDDQMEGWRRALERMTPFLEDPALAGRVQQWRAALDRLLEQGC